MPFKPMSIPQIQDPPINEFRPQNLYSGVVYADLQNKITDSQSPNMLNLWYKEKILSKRYGQSWVNASLGNVPIYNAYKNKFNGKIIFHCGTKLYSLDLSTGTPTEIYSGLTASKGSFFVYRNALGVNVLYYKNGYQYVQTTDGITVTAVVGYIPKVIVGRTPTGGGTVLEQYNRLSAGFINSFSGTGSATAYQLTLTGLDATIVTCTISGVTKVEGTDFTVNRTTGIVTFTVAPASGTDNVLITAYKTDTASLAAFMATKYIELYGGTNDNRVFFAGGSNTYYYSGLLDPTYIPENQYNNLGDGTDEIYGFGNQYNTLVVFKSKSIYTITYTVNSDGSNPRFPSERLNDTKGCDMPYTIQLINNSLVWCHSEHGVQILNRTDTKDEKNVSPISMNIDGTNNSKGLLDAIKNSLVEATSCDYWGMYWICVGSKVWVWDYSISSFVQAGNDYENATRLSWFPLTNINANCFFDADGELYLGDRTIGRIAKFTDTYNDFGQAINGYWQTKKLDFGLFDWTKYILEARYSTKSDIATNITTTYTFDDGNRVDSKIDSIYSFGWDTATWDTWQWAVINFAITIRKPVRKKNTIYFQIKFENNNINEDLTILDLAIYYVLQARTR